MAQEIIWQPQPGPQTSLLACPCFEIFFGGARGGGKTDGMLGEWVSHQDQYGENAIGLMIRRERTQLIETIERSRQLFLPLGAKFHEQDKLWRFPNGSRLRFAYLERDSDAEVYQGHSYTRVYVEEIGTFPSSAPIFRLMATLRSGTGIPCGFRATGNPGGPGHQWVRARYIDPAPLGWKTITESYVNPWTKETVLRDRVYIPSKLQDNKYLGGEYVANLQMVGNAQLVRAWLEGDWSVIEGAFFPEFSEARHVIPPFEIPATWLRFRSADWGSARPFSVGWWAIVGDDYRLRDQSGAGNVVVLPRGAMVRYREWYGSNGQPNIGLKIPAEDVADGIVSRETHEPRDLEGNPAITYGVLDPAAFASDGGPSIAERMSRRKVFFRRADNARVSRQGAVGGWDQLRARLIGDGERPMIYFFSTCVDAIRTLPALQHDADRPEDVDSESEDHAPDECFAGGTLIETEIGPIRIEDATWLRKHGTIHSTNGIEDYYGCRLTKKMAVVVRLVFDDGREIICTPNHQFLVDADEWRYASDLAGSEVLCSQSLYLAQFKSSTANAIISVADTFRSAALDYIAWFGKRLTVLFLTAITSIISIMIAAITGWEISNASQLLYICPTGMAVNLQIAGGQLSTKLLLRLLYGIAQRKAALGTSCTMSKTFAKARWSVLMRHASIVARNIRSTKTKNSAANGVAITANPVRCVSVEPLPEQQPVYCLTVPSNKTFAIEGGLLVHNCRYACMSRPYVKEVIKRPQDRILSVGPTNQVALADLWEAQPEKKRARY